MSRSQPVFPETDSTPNVHSISLPDEDRTTVFLQQGNTQSVPVLCLHGNLGSKWWWWPLFEIIPDDFNLIAPDLWGGDDTRCQKQTFNIPAQLHDLHQLVEALNLSRLTLIAHSTSCAVALEYALRYAHRLSALILVAPPPLDGIATPPEVYRYLQTLLQNPARMEDFLSSLMPKLDLTVPANQALLNLLVKDALRYSSRALDGLTRSLEVWHCRDRAGQLSVPLLLIRGRDDHVTPYAVALDTLLAIPHANNLEVIQGAGHSPFIENPLAFTIRLIDFIVPDFTASPPSL